MIGTPRAYAGPGMLPAIVAEPGQAIRPARRSVLMTQIG